MPANVKEITAGKNSEQIDASGVAKLPGIIQGELGGRKSCDEQRAYCKANHEAELSPLVSTEEDNKKCEVDREEDDVRFPAGPVDEGNLSIEISDNLADQPEQHKHADWLDAHPVEPPALNNQENRKNEEHNQFCDRQLTDQREIEG